MTVTTTLRSTPVTVLRRRDVTVEVERNEALRGGVGLFALDPRGFAVAFETHSSMEKAEAAAAALAEQAQAILDQERATGAQREWLR